MKLRLYIRRILPERLKVFWRLSKLLIAPPQDQLLVLDQELVDGCVFVVSREVLLSRLPKDGLVGEVGVWKGGFSSKILEVARPASLHLFDVDFSICEAAVLEHPSVQLHQGLSSKRLAQCESNTFDWIYIDGDHSYEGVMSDIEAAAPLLKPGGLLVFNDYAHLTPNGFGSFGVHAAVTRFACSHRWRFVYFAWQRNGLYDVAIQAPKT